eukprot:TRINITY_DN768_c0_g1_i1.p1 TRINITY_DN768_c0_g1~~TRINITY_DN768_c0_g1_i1.p1  ORF type:complete len:918 (-),score=161.17 TRINITY_DN768_c0_g1_i1:30-2558(-)
MTNVTFIANEGFDGGALYLQGLTSISAPKISYITRSVFQNNFAFENGGAVSFSGSDPGSQVFVETSEFVGNVAYNGNGGAISLFGDTIITNTRFSNNTAVSGGGVYLDDGSIIISHSQFSNNTANTTGGGIMISDNPTMQCGFCFLHGNTATTGGGIHIEANGPLLFYKTVIMYNFASFSGGGVYIGQYSQPQFDSARIIGNSAGNEGCGIASQGILPYFKNSTISNNVAIDGGGVMMQTGMGSTNREAVVPDLNEGVAFNGCNISSNFASGIGGGMYLVSVTPWSLPYDKFVSDNTTFELNYAGSGGGLAVNDWSGESPIMIRSVFKLNQAIVSGGAAFFNILVDENKIDYNSFCFDCDFVSNIDSQGYQNSNGTATVPLYSVLSVPPPSFVPLSSLSFNVSVVLVDAFNNSIKGEYLNITRYVASVTTRSSSCTMLNSPTTVFSPDSGVAQFQIRLLSLASSDCSLCFSTNFSTSNDICTTVSVGGCPGGWGITTNPGTNFQECQETNSNSVLYILSAVAGFILIAFIIFFIQWYRRSYQLRYTEIPDFINEEKRPSLQDILADPLIPHVKWEEFELKERIGIGATGVVNRAIWVRGKNKQEVAVKQLTISRNTLSSPNMDNFLVEIKFLSSINHPNVVKLLGIASPCDNELNIIMELMERGNLRDIIAAKSRNLTFELKIKLATDVAMGMEYLHNCKVIHRDLKPENLLVDNSWTCKVGDLGMSTIKPKIERTMTQIGTPLYVAPEVFSKGRYTEKADVFSFAIVLLELYTCVVPFGSAPYDQMLSSEIMFKVINENLRPPLPGDCPLSLAQLIYDCWDSSPDRRPSFTEIVARLNRCI